jgi:hypothetical protein
MEKIDVLKTFNTRKELKMNNFEFISHETYPEDEYTREIAIFRLKVPTDVIYCRKKTKDGSYFWTQATVSVTKNGRKEFLDAFAQDSKFLEKDIKSFLENKKWLAGQSVSMKEVAKEPELPF